MTLPVYSENDPNIFDDLDGEPGSIDYFVEKGFEIYTLNDKYGNYLIPYKLNNSILKSVFYTDNNGGLQFDALSIKTETKNKGELTMLVSLSLFPLPYEGALDLIIISSDVKSIDVPFTQQILDTLVLLDINMTSDYNNLLLLHAHSRAPAEPFISNDQKNTNSIYFDLHPPLKQTQNEITSTEILCRNELHLVFQQDDSPACIQKETIKKLTDRNWIKQQ